MQCNNTSHKSTQDPGRPRFRYLLLSARQLRARDFPGQVHGYHALVTVAVRAFASHDHEHGLDPVSHIFGDVWVAYDRLGRDGVAGWNVS